MTLARLTWIHPETNAPMSYDLAEGARVTIGRAAANEISVPHVTVSRQHALIEYADGMFILSDLGSSNGTFLNDQQVLTPQPLMSGDRIRLFGPELNFVAVEAPADLYATQPQPQGARLASGIVDMMTERPPAYLMFLSGPQKDHRVPLAWTEVRIGRATQNHVWEIGVQDTAVSRPHARLMLSEGLWMIYDLGSSNGTMVNNIRVTEKGKILADGDIITVGSTMLQFRSH